MDDPAERTCYVTNLDDRLNDEHLEELFIQAGPVERIVLRTNPNSTHRYALVIYQHEESVPFACDLMDRIRLYDKRISVRPKSGSIQEKKYRAKQFESVPCALPQSTASQKYNQVPNIHCTYNDVHHDFRYSGMNAKMEYASSEIKQRRSYYNRSFTKDIDDRIICSRNRENLNQHGASNSRSIRRSYENSQNNKIPPTTWHDPRSQGPPKLLNETSYTSVLGFNQYEVPGSDRNEFSAAGDAECDRVEAERFRNRYY